MIISCLMYIWGQLTWSMYLILFYVNCYKLSKSIENYGFLHIFHPFFLFVFLFGFSFLFRFVNFLRLFLLTNIQFLYMLMGVSFYTSKQSNKQNFQLQIKRICFFIIKPKSMTFHFSFNTNFSH